MGRRIRKPDLNDNIIDSDNVINKTLTIDDIKTETDTDAVTAETLPYERTSPTPTIWDEINALILGTGFTFDTHVSSAATDYVITGSRRIDITKLLLVFYNGQVMREGATYDYEITTTTLGDDTVQFKWTPEVGYEIYVVFEALP